MATGEGRRGVTSPRGLKGRSHCSRNMFPIIVYAFTAHNQRVAHRRVRNGRPRQAARSVAVPSPAAASTGLSVRRRASTEHLGSAPGGPSQPPCPTLAAFARNWGRDGVSLAAAQRNGWPSEGHSSSGRFQGFLRQQSMKNSQPFLSHPCLTLQSLHSRLEDCTTTKNVNSTTSRGPKNERACSPSEEASCVSF